MTLVRNRSEGSGATEVIRDTLTGTLTSLYGMFRPFENPTPVHVEEKNVCAERQGTRAAPWPDRDTAPSSF